ncbi:MAG TPA: DNA cytosine methyltransferase [Gemmatimonadaceae bacterium]|nr:DNA cytosine methyltransferase [Gemmatimonadaceae bacterium]
MLELLVDSFAGGGGASEGIRLALGRDPDIAINHDAEAIELHKANHPATRHYREDVWKVDPVKACSGWPVGLLWLSPDCKHFSKAKGGKPVSKRVRGLAWVAVRWAVAVKPRVIILENVEEFQTWGPVLRSTGRPCPARKGQTFRRFVAKLRRLGYVVDWRELRACDYGAPTSRKRLFLIARCDGRAIVWPQPTHGNGRAYPWRTAAECIDWSLPCPSIFLTREEARAVGVKRPLAEATMRRIARGVQRYVLDAAEPFIVRCAHGEESASGKRWGSGEESLGVPIPTVTASKDFALVVPYLIPRYGERDGQAPRTASIERPLPTIVPTQNGAQMVAAFLAKHYTERHESDVMAASLFDPTPTITTSDHNALVASSLVKLRGTSQAGQPLDVPAATITAGGTHLAEVRAFLVAYYGNEQEGQTLFDPMRTVTSRDRMGLVAVHGEAYAIADIGMRMLAPRELYRAQGFPDTYAIDIEYNGRPLSKTAQVRMVGNSVCPPLAAAIVAANVPTLSEAVAA